MTTTPKHYDLIVVGAGGGNKISAPASKAGLKVAVVEHGFDYRAEDDRIMHHTGLGGTCLTRGCIPSKMLIHVADIVTTMKDAHRVNVNVKDFDVDYTALVDRVSKTVDEDSFGINERWKSNPNLDYYPHSATFTGVRRIRVGDAEITADKIFLAPGSRPRIPNIKGLEGTPYLTSTDALRLRKKPKSMIVLGGGYIACELGYFFSAVGVPVEMIARQDSLLVHEDQETAAEFTRVFTSHVPTHLGYEPTEVSYANGEFVVRVQMRQGSKNRKAEDLQPAVLELRGEHLLLATGVVPNTDALNVAATGVTQLDGGFIEVDPFLRTGCDGVWAMGDAIGRYLFRHAVNWEAQYLYEHVIMQPTPQAVTPVDYTGMPHAVFSYPQVAGVGETEQELQRRNATYIRAVNKYSSSAMGMALVSDHGFVKLLVERGTRRILGAHIVGHEASSVIHTILPLLRQHGRLDELLMTIYIHPALPEIVRNCARVARDALMAAGDQLPPALQVA